MEGLILFNKYSEIPNQSETLNTAGGTVPVAGDKLTLTSIEGQRWPSQCGEW